MLFYKLNPECCGWFGRRTLYAGELEKRPPTIHRLEYEFKSWPTDHLLEVNCQFIGSTDLITSLAAVQPRVTGLHYEAVTATNSFEMRQEQPGRNLPDYKWFKITGKAGKDDFGMADDHALVISERVFNAIAPMVEKCHVAIYVEATPVDPQT
jgi:hypothetical protein